MAGAFGVSPGWQWLRALLQARGVRAIAHTGYRLVVRCCDQLLHGAFPAGPSRREAEAMPAAESGDYRPTSRLFLRALGVVYLLVFASLAVQVHLLIGSDGLLPERDFLAVYREEGISRFWRFPTLFWLWDGDVAVRGGTILGLALALGLTIGWRSKACLVGLWLLFLSYATVGRDFFWFQWDNLLLESTSLALLLPASPAVAPHAWVVFLFRWLLFRLLFESGLAKVQGGVQSWLPLTAMASYYETAPLPSLGGWYAHQLPLWIHRWTSALTLLGELLGPLLIWGPRGARRLAFVMYTGFQMTIQATANYGYFNILSFVISLFLLDARDLAWLPQRVVGAPATPPANGSRPDTRLPLLQWLIGGAAVVIFLLSVLEMMVLVAGPGVAASRVLVGVRELYLPFRVVSKYHLFADIDPRRVEAEIQWTVDGQEWRPYHFHYKPGPLHRAPPMVAPHQPRVDFQLWFFTLGRDGGSHEYVNTLVRRLCTQPGSVQQLFEQDSLPERPPRAIRIAYYRYWMADLATRARAGIYWMRELLGHSSQVYPCDAPALPRF